MSTSLSPLSTSSTTSSSMYPFCNCRYHLTREHLWTNERKTDGCVFFIPNPYYESSKGKSKKTLNPCIGKSTTNFKQGRNPNGTLCKSTNFSHVSTPKSSTVPSKFDVWNNIKSTFSQVRKLGPVPKKGNVISSPSITPNKSVSPFDRFPFLPMPGSANQVQFMVNPFASRNGIKAPADELSVMFFEIIDLDMSVQSMYLEYPILPESPISPVSPISTTSLPIDNVKIKTEDSEVNEFRDINPTIVSGHILDEISILDDFNEYEFDKMISSLPDVIETAVSVSG